MSLGTNIYRLRTGRGLSQGDLADALQVSRQSISKWEVGGAVPDLDKLLALSDLFGVSLDDLVRGEVPEEAPDVPTGQPEPEAEASASTPDTEEAASGEGGSSTGRIVIICILVFLGLMIVGPTIAPLLGFGLPFILIGLVCMLVAMRK